MLIKKEDVFTKLRDYLNHSISLSQLVDWAENAMMEGEFESRDFDVIRDIVSRLGLADIKAFGLQWEECEKLLNKLGYKVKLNFEYA